MVRFAKDGHPKPIMTDGDRPKIYGSELEATKDALSHVLRFMNGVGPHALRRDGEIMKATARAEFDRIFRKGKVIQVERKGA
jgi:hypothetical protein